MRAEKARIVEVISRFMDGWSVTRAGLYREAVTIRTLAEWLRETGTRGSHCALTSWESLHGNQIA